MRGNPGPDSTRATGRLVALAAAVAVVTAQPLLPQPARAAVAWTETRTAEYSMGEAGPIANLDKMILQAPGCGADRSGGDVRRGDLLLGKVCLGVTRGDTLVVRIEDDSGRRVGGVIKVSWSRFSTDHDFIRPFCGTSGPLPVVAGYLTVHLDAPGDVRGAHAHGGPGCTEIRPLGRNTGATTQGATVGRVRVTFTGEEKGPT